MSKRRFFYHYNKPASQQAKRRLWSVHFKDRCLIAPHIRCEAVAETKERKTQPVAVMQGFASDVTIKDGIITIHA